LLGCALAKGNLYAKQILVENNASDGNVAIMLSLDRNQMATMQQQVNRGDMFWMD